MVYSNVIIVQIQRNIAALHDQWHLEGQMFYLRRKGNTELKYCACVTKVTFRFLSIQTLTKRKVYRLISA